MKENKYDDAVFFEKYSHFPRSVEGLNAAGEWHAFEKMMPDFFNKRVLDVGCGFGWHCFYAAEHGAKSVLGIDLSEKMLEMANEKNTFSNVRFERMAMEDICFPKDSFDVVISSLAFHYSDSFSDLCKQICACLVPDGKFVFSVEHPIFTAEGAQEWCCDEDGHLRHWPVDNYFLEGKRKAVFLEEQIIKYHRTLSTYLSTLLETGFMITGVVEPKPSEHLLKTVRGMENELRRPMMLLISAEKKKA